MKKSCTSLSAVNTTMYEQFYRILRYCIYYVFLLTDGLSIVTGRVVIAYAGFCLCYR